eukprot:Nk52_evm10s1607 gene=Nk52_evmTU10s1607
MGRHVKTFHCGARVVPVKSASKEDEDIEHHHSVQGVVVGLEGDHRVRVKWDNGTEGIVNAEEIQPFRIRFTPFRVMLTLTIFLFWAFVSTWEHKLAGLAIAGGFSVVEFFWYGLTEWDNQGRVCVIPLKNFSFSRCHTTKKMFISLLVTSPLLIEVQNSLAGMHPLVRISAFPLKVWFLEVAVGYYLLLVWNCRAWIYKGRDSMFSGTIKLGYVGHWMLIGTVVVSVLFMLTPEVE